MFEKTDFHTCYLQEINMDTAESAAHINTLHQSLSMTANCHDQRASFSHQMAIRKAINKKATGTAVVINNDTNYQTLPMDTTSTPNISASISTYKGETLITYGLYCPTTGNKKKDEAFSNYLHQVEAIARANQIKYPSAHKVFCGDFNINPKSASKTRLEAYNNFKTSLGLTEHKPKSNTFFSKSQRAGSSLLDWILTSEKISVEAVNTITREEVTHSGDHLPVQYKINIPLPPDQNDNGPPSLPLVSNKNYINRKKIDWDLVDKSLYKLLANHFVKYVRDEIKDTCSTPLQLKIISDQLSLAAQLASRQPEKTHSKKKSQDMVHYENKITKNNNIIRKICNRNNINQDISIPEIKNLMKDTQIPLSTLNTLKNLKLERLKLRSKHREASSNWNKEQVDIINDEIDYILHTKKLDQLYKEFSKLDRKANIGPPELIEYKGKKYTGEQVLKGFENLTEERSQNKRKDDPLDDHYKQVTEITKGLSELYKESHTKIQKMSQEKYKEVLASLPLKKAEDINNTTLENILHTDEETLDILRNLTNNIILDWEDYSTVIFNTVKAQMLFKGRGKTRENPMNYRRISVGNIWQKTIDKYMSEETQQIARQAQGSSQYGFSKGVNFLLLSLLRENVQKYATEFKKLLICFATDISDAFSQTCRNSQLYECHLAGESHQVWKYTEATYTETHTVLCEGNRLGKLIEEQKGSRQGGIKSAPDFKLYYLMLERMLRAADLGYKIQEMDQKMFLQLVADDGMSWISSVEELQAVIHLFEYYADRYKMTFSFPKTLINIYGSKEQIESVKSNDGIRVAGNPPIFPEEALHLGLIQCQDISRTEEVNVRARIKKATIKFYSLFGNRFKSSTPLRIELSKMIWNTYIKPTLLTGLNALTVDKYSLQLLKDFEATVLRSIFKVRKKAPLTHLYQLSGIEPIEATLHKSCFSLFHNVWMNPQTPSAQLIKIILENPTKYTLNYWPKHIQMLARRYKIPDPAILLQRRHPDKEKWKSYIAKKINQHHQQILKEKIYRMTTTTFLLDSTIHKYIKSGQRFLQTPRTTTEVSAAHIKSIMIAGEYPTKVHEKRIRGKNTDSENCKHCDITTRDTTIHLLEQCRITETKKSIESRSEILTEYAAATGRCPSILDQYFRLNPGSFTTFVLNPAHSSIPTHLRITSYNSTSQLLNSISQYCWVIHNQRIRISKCEFSRNGSTPIQPGSDGQGRDQDPTNGKQDKITKFFSPDSDTEKSDYDSDHSDDSYQSNHQNSDSLTFQVMVDKNGDPERSYNAKDCGQLLGVIINPGTAIIQGSIFPSNKPGYKMTENGVLFRNHVARNVHPFPYYGAVEFFSASRSLLKSLVVMTTEEFSPKQMSSILTNSKIKLSSVAHHHVSGHENDEKIPISIIALERGTNHPPHVRASPPKTIFIRKMWEKDPLPGLSPGYSAYFISEDKIEPKLHFGRSEDYKRYDQGTYLGRSAPIEILEDWRCGPRADSAATLLALAWERGDEEAARTAAINITEREPSLYPHIVERLSDPHNIVSHGSVTAYAKKILEVDHRGRMFVSEAHFRNRERNLENIRFKVAHPEQNSTAYRMDRNCEALNTRIEGVIDMLGKALATTPPPKNLDVLAPQDLRRKIRKSETEDSDISPPIKQSIKVRLGKKTPAEIPRPPANTSGSTSTYNSDDEIQERPYKRKTPRETQDDHDDTVDLTRSSSGSSTKDPSSSEKSIHSSSKSSDSSIRSTDPSTSSHSSSPGYSGSEEDSSDTSLESLILDGSFNKYLLKQDFIPPHPDPLPPQPTPKRDRFLHMVQYKNTITLNAWFKTIENAERLNMLIPKAWKTSIQDTLKLLHSRDQDAIAVSLPTLNTHTFQSPPKLIEGQRYTRGDIFGIHEPEDENAEEREVSNFTSQIPLTPVSDDESEDIKKARDSAIRELLRIKNQTTKKHNINNCDTDMCQSLEPISDEDDPEELNSDLLHLSDLSTERELKDKFQNDERKKKKTTSTPKVQGLRQGGSKGYRYYDQGCDNQYSYSGATDFPSFPWPKNLVQHEVQPPIQAEADAQPKLPLLTQDDTIFIKKVRKIPPKNCDNHMNVTGETPAKTPTPLQLRNQNPAKKAPTNLQSSKMSVLSIHVKSRIAIFLIFYIYLNCVTMQLINFILVFLGTNPKCSDTNQNMNKSYKTQKPLSFFKQQISLNNIDYLYKVPGHLNKIISLRNFIRIWTIPRVPSTSLSNQARCFAAPPGAPVVDNTSPLLSPPIRNTSKYEAPPFSPQLSRRHGRGDTSPVNIKSNKNIMYLIYCNNFNNFNISSHITVPPITFWF